MKYYLKAIAELLNAQKECDYPLNLLCETVGDPEKGFCGDGYKLLEEIQFELSGRKKCDHCNNYAKYHLEYKIPGEPEEYETVCDNCMEETEENYKVNIIKIMED